jgi:flagellar hook assembly protein FlgD
VTAVITAEGGAVVRTLTARVDAGDASIPWDGRSSAGKAVADGRYTVTLSATDPAGNASGSATWVVDVYAALASLTRTPSLFFPQDGDALATKTKATWTLLAPAVVSVEVRDLDGTVVRTAYTARELPAGPAAWTWNGKRQDGTWAARGRYRIVVSATNGTQLAAQATVVIADAWRITTSATSAVRGKSLTITARTAEPLSTTPSVRVAEPGLDARSVTMTKVNSTTWTARITPRTSAQPGTLSLTVRARDVDGGTNSTGIRLALE